MAKVETITHVLAVPDLQACAGFWQDVMGFELWLEPDGWAFLRRDAIHLRIGECKDAIHPKDLGDHQYFAYWEVDDVDAWHQEISRKGANILFEPKDQPWGMRECGIGTPDGHRFMIAKQLD